MELKPFTLEDAEEICEDFVDMKDTELTFGGVGYMVEDVVVCPFSDADKDAFFTTYQLGHGNSNDLSKHTDNGFDVTLVVTKPEGGSDDFFLIGIRQYIAEKGVNYNFP